jgi:hypothetical protein
VPAIPKHIYHLAEANNWPSIKKLGLLTAQQLLEKSGLPQNISHQIELQQRQLHTILPGGFEIRDQSPMPADALERCLVGLKPPDWYRLVNARVFFWTDHDRLERQRAACRGRPQVILTIDAERLVQAYLPRVAVTPINTGNARRKAALRSEATFVPYLEWLKTRWDHEAKSLGTKPRPRSHRIVEVTVFGGVPDIMRHIIKVDGPN